MNVMTRCDLCGKVFRVPAEYQRHKNKKTPCLIVEVAPEQINNPNRCIYCNKTFVQKQTLTRHLNSCKVKNGEVKVPNDNVKYEQEIRILREEIKQLVELQNLQANQIKALNKMVFAEGVKNDDTGYIYFIIQTPFNNRVKIGYSNNPLKRVKQLQTGNPNRLTIYFATELVEYKDLERTMHDICKDLRMIGEWFEISESGLNGLISGL